MRCDSASLSPSPEAWPRSRRRNPPRGSALAGTLAAIVPVTGSSIHAYNSAILLHGISKGMFRLFDIYNNSIYPGSTVQVVSVKGREMSCWSSVFQLEQGFTTRS